MAELPAVPALSPLTNIAVHPYDIALIVDGVVYDTLNVDGQFAARLLAQPKFVQFAQGTVRLGYLYDETTGTFSAPVDPVNTDALGSI